MKVPKIKLNKIKNFFEKLPETLGERAFLSSLGLLLLSLILGGLIFYQYAILAEKKEPEISKKPLQFNEKNYQEILRVWQEKEKRFQEADLKEYLDLFREIKQKSPISSETEETKEKAAEGFYIISKGETLWELAEKYLGDGHRWQEIKNENGQTFTEGSTYHIPIGQKLIIPEK